MANGANGFTAQARGTGRAREHPAAAAIISARPSVARRDSARSACAPSRRPRWRRPRRAGSGFGCAESCRTSKRGLPGSRTEPSWLARVAAMKLVDAAPASRFTAEGDVHRPLPFARARARILSAGARPRQAGLWDSTRSGRLPRPMRSTNSISRCRPERSRSIPRGPRRRPAAVCRRGRLEDRAVRDLPRLLRPGDLLVVNDTKVLPARLFGRRGTVPIEATLIAEAGPAAGGRSSARPADCAPATGSTSPRISPPRSRTGARTARCCSTSAADATRWPRSWTRTGRRRCRPTSAAPTPIRGIATTTRRCSRRGRVPSRRRPRDCTSRPNCWRARCRRHPRIAVTCTWARAPSCRSRRSASRITSCTPSAARSAAARRQRSRLPGARRSHRRRRHDGAAPARDRRRR